MACTLGIEGGGTKTAWVLVDSSQKVLMRGNEVAANYHQLGAQNYKNMLLRIRDQVEKAQQEPVMFFYLGFPSFVYTELSVVGIFLPGLCAGEKQDEAKNIAQSLWPKAQIKVDDDGLSGFYAAFGTGDGMLVIAGTGSIVVGRKNGEWQRIGGYGHIAGDQGSAYDAARRAFQMAFSEYDRANGRTNSIAQALLRFSGENTMSELITNLYSAPEKSHVAQFAEVVVEQARTGDAAAQRILMECARDLANQVTCLQGRLHFPDLQIALRGGMFENSPEYVNYFKEAIEECLPSAHTFLSETPGEFGAVAYALGSNVPITTHVEGSESAKNVQLSNIPTEQRNPRSHGLHLKSAEELVRLFIDEEEYNHRALKTVESSIVKACELVAEKIGGDGRLFYVGSGTSGRLGVLDASEIPPTFGASSQLVQGIIAGRSGVLLRAEEGAEDNATAGAIAIRERGVTQADVVWGIAASGRTPFVLGALKEAQLIGAATVMLSCNPNWSVDGLIPNVGIHLPTGAELITGSTRLKAGTVTKLVLNMASSIAMIRNGKVFDNLMVNVQPVNGKLRARARLLVMTLTKCSEKEACEALDYCGWNVANAIKHMTKIRSDVGDTKIDPMKTTV